MTGDRNWKLERSLEKYALCYICSVIKFVTKRAVILFSARKEARIRDIMRTLGNCYRVLDSMMLSDTQKTQDQMICGRRQTDSVDLSASLLKACSGAFIIFKGC